MGIDTRFWGPSGWDLFHRISFHSQDKSALKSLGEVLPCKFCRNSTLKFIKKHPFNETPQWLYEIHNMVNNKLRTQCLRDPKVINPGEDPLFEDIKQKYADKKLDEIVGGKFLLSIAVNFTNTPHRREIQKRFLHNLSKSYPKFREYYETHSPDFNNYPEWMNGFVKGSISEVESYKGKCKRGKTCRKMRGGKMITIRNKQTK